jgi:hypothetical protein
MKAFEQMTHDEQLDHLFDVHGVGSTEELTVRDIKDAMEAHQTDHDELIGDEHTHNDE